MSEEENESGMLKQRAVTPIVEPIGAEWWPRDIDNSIAEVRVWTHFSTVIDQCFLCVEQYVIHLFISRFYPH